ncbi:MAG: hypothetical protein Q8P61_08700 [Candidatus Nanopelagicales bacterium]|nr:hypothetical protein [Candidatus Nanopelagicales bacterium]
MERLRRVWRWFVPAIPLAAVVGVAFAMAGFVVGMNVGIDDPQVQAGIVGAAAGIVGGLIGATVGAWSAGRVADRTLADAQAARDESRDEARRVRFLDERRAAIVDVVLASDRAVAIAMDRGRRGPEALKKPLPPPEGPGMDRAMAVLRLLAPDLSIETGPAYRNATLNAVHACVDWAADPGSGDGDAVRKQPDFVTQAISELHETESRFMADAAFHLGIIDYAGERLAELIEAAGREKSQEGVTEEGD